ncbi:hypothetical protein VXI92_002416 [Enterobacter hormaechei]|uniref:Uncharacterized protein n=1 Tax=Enterobacter hormaechei TaxID=158836 RepID=A0AAE8X5Y6_9ENTR|nr:MULTISPECIES: hypothetical protein [Enterobacter]AVO82769.1 hypothetical protein AM472_10120 [Enterobacter cloacae complex sp.]CAE7564245.1 hypothetical protein AI2759V1_1075 [Enterobacter cloacae]AJB80843.1 hypothetical protein LI66_05515 [Enterobacter hormaechei subsp. xiangfangensis]ATW94189.1 hypothetical protein CU081_22030 [Enterobacter sp. CRENT-193]EGQ5254957.1 hypothetical protein [Enterobacter hormaechei]
MATTPGFSYVHAEESAVNHLLHLQLPDSADLFELTDTCAAYVSVLVETDDAVTFAMLCKQLLAALKRLRECCDAELPSHLVEQLIAGEKIASCVPDCWQDTALQVDYAVALTLAVMGGTLPASVAKELTGLLHDMVWLLADFVKEPYITAH